MEFLIRFRNYLFKIYDFKILTLLIVSENCGIFIDSEQTFFCWTFLKLKTKIDF